VEDNGKLVADKDIEILQEKLAMDSKQMEKTGLINVNNRLKLKYRAGSGVYVSRSQYGGLKVELVIMNENEEA